MAGGFVFGREGRTLALAGLAAMVALSLLAGGSARAGILDFNLVDIGNFSSPVFAEDAPGADGHLYVVEQRGTIEVLVNETRAQDPFLDIDHLVRSGGEEGLLSVAFHPNYDSNRRFYVYYNTNRGDIRIDQFRRRANDPLSADVGSREKIVKVEHNQAANHNGGQLQFGPDGYLYAGIGDGGPQGDPENDAQKKKSLLGKLIRIEPLPNGGHASPEDNPFVGEPGRNAIAARGLRNPWRFSFDAANGALLLADVGGGAREEVNYDAGRGLAQNFGWNDYEGFDETPFGTGANANPHHEPIADFTHGPPDNFNSITGGYVVHDPGLPALSGQYVFGDAINGEVQALQIPAGLPGTVIGESVGLLSSFGEGENGQIYVVDLEGDVFRLEQTQ